MAKKKSTDNQAAEKDNYTKSVYFNVKDKYLLDYALTMSFNNFSFYMKKLLLEDYMRTHNPGMVQNNSVPIQNYQQMQPNNLPLGQHQVNSTGELIAVDTASGSSQKQIKEEPLVPDTNKEIPSSKEESKDLEEVKEKIEEKTDIKESVLENDKDKDKKLPPPPEADVIKSQFASRKATRPQKKDKEEQE